MPDHSSTESRYAQLNEQNVRSVVMNMQQARLFFFLKRYRVERSAHHGEVFIESVSCAKIFRLGCRLSVRDLVLS